MYCMGYKRALYKVLLYNNYVKRRECHIALKLLHKILGPYLNNAVSTQII